MGTMSDTDLVIFYRTGKDGEGRAVEAPVTAIEPVIRQRANSRLRVVFAPFYDTAHVARLKPARTDGVGARVVADYRLDQKGLSRALKSGKVASGVAVSQTDLHLCGAYTFQYALKENPLEYGNGDPRNWRAFHVTRVYISDLPLVVFVERSRGLTLWPPRLPSGGSARTRWVFRRKAPESAAESALTALNVDIQAFCLELDAPQRRTTEPITRSMSREKGMTVTLALCGARPSALGEVVQTGVFELGTWPYGSWREVKLSLVAAGVSASDYLSLYMEYAHRHPRAGVIGVAEVHLIPLDFDDLPRYETMSPIEIDSISEATAGVYTFQINSAEDVGFEQWSTVFACEVAVVDGVKEKRVSTGSEVIMTPLRSAPGSDRYVSRVDWIQLQESQGMRSTSTSEVAKLMNSAYPIGQTPCGGVVHPHFRPISRPLLYGKMIKWSPATTADTGLYFCLRCDSLGVGDDAWSVDVFDPGAETMSSSFRDTQPFLEFAIMAALTRMAVNPGLSQDQLATELRALFDRAEPTRRVFRSIVSQVAAAVHSIFNDPELETQLALLTVAQGLGADETKKQSDIDYYPPGLAFTTKAVDPDTVEVALDAFTDPRSDIVSKSLSHGPGVMWRAMRKLAREAPGSYDAHETDLMRVLWRYVNVTSDMRDRSPVFGVASMVYDDAFRGGVVNTPPKEVGPFLGLPLVEVCEAVFLDVDPLVKTLQVQTNAVAALETIPYAYEIGDPDYTWTVPRYGDDSFRSPLYFNQLFQDTDHAFQTVAQLLDPGVGFSDLQWRSPSYIKPPIRTASEAGVFTCNIDFGGNPMPPYDVSFNVLYRRDVPESAQPQLPLLQELISLPQPRVAVDTFIKMVAAERGLPPGQRLRPGTSAAYAILLSPTQDAAYTRYNVNAGLAGVLAEYFGHRGDERQARVLRAHLQDTLADTGDFQGKKEVKAIVDKEGLLPYFLLSLVTKLDLSLDTEDEEFMQALYEALVRTARARRDALNIAMEPRNLMAAIETALADPETARVLLQLMSFSEVTEGAPYSDVDFEALADEFVDGEFLTASQLTDLKRNAPLTGLLDKFQSKPGASPRQTQAVLGMRANAEALPAILRASGLDLGPGEGAYAQYARGQSLGALKRAQTRLSVSQQPFRSQWDTFFLVRVPNPPLGADTRAINNVILSVVDVPAAIIKGEKREVLESVRSMSAQEEVAAFEELVTELDVDIIAGGSVRPESLDNLMSLSELVRRFERNPAVPPDTRRAVLADAIPQEELRRDVVGTPGDDLVSARLKRELEAGFRPPLTRDVLRTVLGGRPHPAQVVHPSLPSLFDEQFLPLYSAALDRELQRIVDANASNPIKTVPDFIRFMDPLQAEAEASAVDDPDLKQLLADANASAIAKAVDAAASQPSEVTPQQVEAMSELVPPEVLDSLLAKLNERGQMQPETQRTVDEKDAELGEEFPAAPGVPLETQSNPYAQLFLPQLQPPLVSSAVKALADALETLPLAKAFEALASAYVDAFGVSPPGDKPRSLERFDALFSGAAAAQFGNLLKDDVVDALFDVPGMPLFSARALGQAVGADPRLTSVNQLVDRLKCSACEIFTADELKGRLSDVGSTINQGNAEVSAVVSAQKDASVVAGFKASQAVGVPLYRMLFAVYAEAFRAGLEQDGDAVKVLGLANDVRDKVAQNGTDFSGELAVANRLFDQSVPPLMLRVYLTVDKNKDKFDRVTRSVAGPDGDAARAKRSLLPEFTARTKVKEEYKDKALTAKNVEADDMREYDPKRLLGVIDAHLDLKLRGAAPKEEAQREPEVPGQAAIGAVIDPDGMFGGAKDSLLQRRIDAKAAKAFEEHCAVGFPIHVMVGSEQWAAITAQCPPKPRQPCYGVDDVASVVGLSAWRQGGYGGSPGFMEKAMAVIKGGKSTSGVPGPLMLDAMLKSFRRNLAPSDTVIQKVPLALFLMFGTRMVAVGGGDDVKPKVRSNWLVYHHTQIIPKSNAGQFAQWLTSRQSRILLYNSSSILPYRWETVSEAGDGGQWLHWTHSSLEDVTREDVVERLKKGVEKGGMDVFVELSASAPVSATFPRLAQLYDTYGSVAKKAMEMSASDVMKVVRGWSGYPVALYDVLRSQQRRFLNADLLDQSNPLFSISQAKEAGEVLARKDVTRAEAIATTLISNRELIEGMSGMKAPETKLDSDMFASEPLQRRVELFVEFVKGG